MPSELFLNADTPSLTPIQNKAKDKKDKEEKRRNRR
jgi:hypothetical protein